MPIWRRSSRKPAPPRGSGLPSKAIVPSSMVSSPLTQRSSVVLPDPERPTIATTSPDSTESDTSSSTRFAPNRLRMPFKAKSGIDFSFQLQRQQRQRPADGEVERGDDRVDDHGRKRDVDDELTRTRKLD